jgi:uncharacterized protein with GYD domain
MPRYLVEATYDHEAFTALVRAPHSPIEQIEPAVSTLGGCIETAYFAFGDCDLILIVELPDNVSAAALSMAASASGGLRLHRTTPLIGITDSLEAMHRAAGVGYRSPSEFVSDWS